MRIKQNDFDNAVFVAKEKYLAAQQEYEIFVYRLNKVNEHLSAGDFQAACNLLEKLIREYPDRAYVLADMLTSAVNYAWDVCTGDKSAVVRQPWYSHAKEVVAEVKAAEYAS